MNKIALLLALMVTTTTQAEIYRWVDENGVTVYSEMPPPDGEADRVKTAPAPPETPEAMQQQQEAEMQKLEDYLEDKELAAEKKQKGQLSKQIDEENCRNAKDNLDKLIAASQRLLQMPDGNYVRLTEEQRQQRMEEARKFIDENCK